MKCLLGLRVDVLQVDVMEEASILLMNDHETQDFSRLHHIHIGWAKADPTVVCSALLSMVPGTNSPQSLPQSVRALGMAGCGG
jgi:hypothetical protein